MKAYLEELAAFVAITLFCATLGLWCALVAGGLL